MILDPQGRLLRRPLGFCEPSWVVDESKLGAVSNHQRTTRPAAWIQHSSRGFDQEPVMNDEGGQ